MAEATDNIPRLKELLDAHHVWPSVFTFKFIVAEDGVDAVKSLLAGTEPTIKPSAKGKYVSVTFHVTMPSSAAVLDVYAQARLVPGIIAL